jgi:Ca-activated chloride channel family protein
VTGMCSCLRSALAGIWFSSAIFASCVIGQPRVSVEPRLPVDGSNQPRADIRVDSNLVLVPVSVTDGKNRSVTGLDRETFRVFEGKEERKLLHFSSDDLPLSVGIVFDASGSMADKLRKSREAVAQFLKTANTADEFFLVEFSDRAKLSVPFTNSADEIQNRLMTTESKGKTALLDAVYMALDYMKKAANPRRALLVISDGGDNDSRYTARDIRDRARESDAWIYAIGIYPSHTIFAEEAAGPQMLSTLAEETGGRQFAITNPNELPDVAEKIGLELRNQYLLGFAPGSEGQDGKYHRVQVKVVQHGNLHVSSRPGYYAAH